MKTKIKVFPKHFHLVLLFLLVALLTNNIQYTIVGSQLTPPSGDTWISDVSYYSAPTKGKGTQEDPILIESEAHLAYIGTNISFYYNYTYLKLVKDLDLGAHLWIPLGKAEQQAAFQFDGDNHSISNIRIKLPNSNNVGFFGYSSGNISNLHLANIDIVGNTNVGSISGFNFGTIQNCSATSGTIIGMSENVGGIAGKSGIIIGCVANLNVKTYTRYAGGMEGCSTTAGSGVVKNCYFSGQVEADTYAAGLSGQNAGTITGSIAEGTIIATNFAAGISCQQFLNCEDSGFNGKIQLKGTTNNCASISYDTMASSTIKNCYGIADIFLNTLEATSANIFGTNRSGQIGKSTLSYTKIYTKNGLEECRKFKIGSSEVQADAFSGWSYSPFINGGFPFPTGLFAVGGFSEKEDVLSYLKSYKFDSYTINVQWGEYGPYVKRGSYPQTYVGSSLNATLEGWYTSNASTCAYWLDSGPISGANYFGYSFTDGNTYVRIPAVSNSSLKFGNGETIGSGARWFKVEPITWFLPQFEIGGTAAVSEKVLVASIPWSRAEDDDEGNTFFSVSWSNGCNVRTWLNNSFYTQAKLYTNQESIPNYDTNGNATPNTSDRVWLLSGAEQTEYFNGSVRQKVANPTDFALALGCYVPASINSSTSLAQLYGPAADYFLRNPSRMGADGQVGVWYHWLLMEYWGNASASTYGIRPVVRIPII